MAPRKLDVLVVADGSTDGWVSIAESFGNRGVRVLHSPPREGKTQALNHGVSEAKSEILFFSDANTFYEPETPRIIMSNFADPEVGGVSGRKIVLPDHVREASKGETAYWSYESSLKIAESTFGSIVTADMGRFLRCAVNYTVQYRGVSCMMTCISRSRSSPTATVVYEPAATSAEYASRTLNDEFHLKVRYASAGFQIFAEFKPLLLNPTYWFAWEFFSHKLIRWLIPFFLLGVLMASALLASSSVFFGLVFWGQVAFYVLGLAVGCFQITAGALSISLGTSR